MRQTLFRIALDHPWSGWFAPPGGLPQLGVCWVWLIVCAGWLLYHAIRGHWALLRDPVVWLKAGVVLIGFSLIHYLGFVPDSVPVFGYGMMVLLGFVAGLTFSYYRAKSVGYDPEIIVDAAFWILISGVAGGRLAFLIQYWNEVFVPGMPLPQALFRAINLSEGGLVLLGALVGGGLGVVTYFYLRKLSVFEFADLLMPAVFIGVGFGRIGCLLNGCCFGDRCELPWAIHFPAGSVTFDVLASRGFLAEGALWTMPLHPTQIYSSIDGFVLAFVTAVFYWYRKHPGDALALGCMLYSITRFFIEFLRADEMGQLGTGLTISQLYSIGIFLLGLILMLTGPMRGATRRPAAALPPQTLPAAAAR